VAPRVYQAVDVETGPAFPLPYIGRVVERTRWSDHDGMTAEFLKFPYARSVKEKLWDIAVRAVMVSWSEG